MKKNYFLIMVCMLFSVAVYAADIIFFQESLLDQSAGTLSEKLRTPQYTEEYFKCLDEFARNIKSFEDTNYTIIKDSKIFSFANEYLKWRQSRIRIKLSNITFKQDPQSKGFVTLGSIAVRVNGKNVTHTVDILKTAEKDKESNVELMLETSVKPLDKVSVWINWHHRGITPWLGKDKSIEIKFNPHTVSGGFDAVKVPEEWIGASTGDGMSGFEYFKVQLEISNTFPQLINKSFGTEKPDKAAIIGNDE